MGRVGRGDIKQFSFSTYSLIEKKQMTLTHLARNLRKNQTDAEQMIWLQLKAKRFLGHKFRRQFPVDPYIVDFICLDLKLIIELDGSQHVEQVDKDDDRTLFLNQRGFKVVRFWNNEVFENLDGVNVFWLFKSLPLAFKMCRFLLPSRIFELRLSGTICLGQLPFSSGISVLLRGVH